MISWHIQYYADFLSITERYKADVTQIMADAGISLQDLDEVDPDSQEISATETDVDLDEQSSMNGTHTY